MYIHCTEYATLTRSLLTLCVCLDALTLDTFSLWTLSPHVRYGIDWLTKKGLDTHSIHHARTRTQALTALHSRFIVVHSSALAPLATLKRPFTLDLRTLKFSDRTRAKRPSAQEVWPHIHTYLLFTCLCAHPQQPYHALNWLNRTLQLGYGTLKRPDCSP